MIISPVTLTGQFVQLVPLELAHVQELARIGSAPEIWKYMRYGLIESESQMSAWVNELLKLQEAGTDLPFTVFHLPSHRIVGATRYLNISQANQTVEVGGTWYGLEFQRTVVNTETKYLLLKYAFEDLHCIRVQFKTDVSNGRSQKAIERLGAVREGVLRNHMILPDGRVRSSVIYSILSDEWPSIEARLASRIV